MKAPRTAGFTLVELLIVVSIIGLLAAAFLPDLLAGKATANEAADLANMRQHQQWFQEYERKAKKRPMHGGHKYLLTLWQSGSIDHTIENFERFWTPGLTLGDAQYQNLRPMVLRNEPIWQDLESLSSLDTHYAARAFEHIITAGKPNEALVANDNEFGWNLDNGTVNILYSQGPRSLTSIELKDTYGWEHAKEEVMRTFGPDAFLEDLRKLEN